MKLHCVVVTLAMSHVAAAESTTVPLNITALSSRAGYSVIECWQLSSVPAAYMAAVNYAVGNTTVATWSRIEPRTTVGEAWAPHIQLSVVLNGLIRITAPAPVADGPDASMCLQDHPGRKERPDTRVFYAMPGTLRSSVLIAADLKSASTLAGHFTEFPSDEPTVLIQIPFVDDKAPAQTVLHEGPCL
ncbi:hypothetical protein N657DRAFT_650638 [Parathielavia appendiculata]|uniref:Small secreted protein n=1 Tax=Parathielavia appendiculata TaxID=2587402 RepID=A0AAN6TRQ8_9PEZI|nr:hypothetical protein N657DRAFT_650638 [Parathielavia appendiculata]